MTETRAVILAAGKGTRMKSVYPKVIHRVCGKPVLQYIVDITRSLKTYVVVGHGAELVRQTIGEGVTYVLQDQMLGTADAVRRVEPHLKNFKGTLLVLCGDTPLLEKAVVTALMRKHKTAKASATVLTAILKDSFGYGRIIRDRQNRFQAIREQKDASAEEAAIKEINVGMYCFNAQDLFKALRKVKMNPSKKEFYLTDVIEVLLAEGKTVDTYTTMDESVAFGINNRADLAQAEAIIRQRILRQHMDNGVTIVDPLTTYIEAQVSIGADTVIQPCTVIHADVKIGSHCSIGPFARLRPGTRIADKTEVGNFAEISRTSIGSGTMVKHFSFLGDARIGQGVNIGAGTVTANYDGKNKNISVIQDGAFIGSDSVLIAPVHIGKKSVTAAGAVVTKHTKVAAGSVVAGVPAKAI